MGGRFSHLMMTVAIAAAAISISISIAGMAGQAPAAPAELKTAWGEPDLQGIWTEETATPLQRSARFTNQEFFTDAQRADLDRQRSARDASSGPS